MRGPRRLILHRHFISSRVNQETLKERVGASETVPARSHSHREAFVLLGEYGYYGIVETINAQLYRQRVQKRLNLLRKRLFAFVIKANPECFDHDGRLAPGSFPARLPPGATDLHGQMRRAEFQLAMIRLQAECRHRELLTERSSSLKNCHTEACSLSLKRHDCSAGTGSAAVVIL
jgi:hypothetical protein